MTDWHSKSVNGCRDDRDLRHQKVNVGCPLKGHKYLNKPVAESICLFSEHQVLRVKMRNKNLEKNLVRFFWVRKTSKFEGMSI